MEFWSILKRRTNLAHCFEGEVRVKNDCNSSLKSRLTITSHFLYFKNINQCVSRDIWFYGQYSKFNPKKDTNVDSNNGNNELSEILSANKMSFLQLDTLYTTFWLDHRFILRYQVDRILSTTLVAQGVSAHLTGHILQASLGGIERVSKIVMCIGTKLCYCLQKLQIS